ncbi:Holliday junction resolvase RuvX [Candidatus Daviesbacteria bacterium]|nr:Holliday junction resolvase RuvX [Candidatus Daviesbacteria bacterium]
MRYLGIDFGLKKIGLAISEGELAAPLKVLEASNFQDAFSKIKKEAADFDKVIIGKPEGKVGKKVTKLVSLLKKESMDIEEWDETLSSQKAMAYMIQSGLGKNKRKITDAYSAAIILQEYLDEKKH